MNTDILITPIVTLLVCLVNNYIQTRNIREENSKSIKLMDYRLNELTKQVEKHNDVIERTYKLEEQNAIQDEKLKVVNHRIDDLEKERTK